MFCPFALNAECHPKKGDEKFNHVTCCPVTSQCVYAFEHLSKKKSEVRIGSSFNTDLDLEREFKLRADSELDLVLVKILI
jgi:hypothetical protein